MYVYMFHTTSITKLWLKVYCTANGWNKAKQLPCLPTLLKGHAWPIFEILGEEHMGTYANLKTALLSKLCLNIDEDRISTSEQLSQMRRVKVWTNLSVTLNVC